MQEEVTHQTVALYVKAAKLSSQVLAKTFQSAIRQIKKNQEKAQAPQGRQSVKKLMQHGVSTNSIDISGSTRMFDRVARKYNVDYSFHKVGAKKYLLFFKAGQADAITAAFSDYTKRVTKKEARPSIRQRLNNAKDLVLTKSRQKQKEHKREAAHDER